MFKVNFQKKFKACKRIPLRVIFRKAAKTKVRETQEQIALATQEEVEDEEELPVAVSVGASNAVNSIAEVLVEYGIVQ